jgi:hypothetical protein
LHVHVEISGAKILVDFGDNVVSLLHEELGIFQRLLSLIERGLKELTLLSLFALLALKLNFEVLLLVRDSLLLLLFILLDQRDLVDDLLLKILKVHLFTCFVGLYSTCVL